MVRRCCLIRRQPLLGILAVLLLTSYFDVSLQLLEGASGSFLNKLRKPNTPASHKMLEDETQKIANMIEREADQISQFNEDTDRKAEEYLAEIKALDRQLKDTKEKYNKWNKKTKQENKRVLVSASENIATALKQLSQMVPKHLQTQVKKFRSQASKASALSAKVLQQLAKNVSHLGH